MSKKRKRYLWLVLFALLAACGPVTASPPVSSIAKSSAPPPATLEIDGKTQIAGIGSYCWSDGEKTGQTVCADLEGIPTAREALLAAVTPYQAHFHLPLGMPPDSLYIAVLPAGVEIVGGANGARLWNPGAGWAGELPLKNEIDYPFQEGPGLYVIQLSAHWKNFGDASYGFLVQVGEKAAPTAPPATAAPTPAPLALKTLSPLMRIGKGAANLLALSKDGRWLAIGTPLGVYLYETATQREVWFRAFDGELRDLAFRPDGAQLAVALSGNQMLIVDTQTGETALTLQGEAGLRGEWSPDGKSILTSGECEQVLVWDAVSGQITHTVQPVKCNIVTPGYVNAIWSGDGKRIYVMNSSRVSARDATTYQPLPNFALEPSENGVGRVIPSPTDDLFVLSNDLNIYQDGEMNIPIMDGKTGKLVRALRTPALNGPIWAIIWSRDGKRVVAAGYHMLCIWDVKSGQLTSTTKDYSALFDLAFMPDDETLVGLFTDEHVLNAVNITTHKPVFTLDEFESWSAIGWDQNDLLTFNGVTEARRNPITGQIIEQHVNPQPELVKANSALHSPDGLIALSKAASDIKVRQRLVELRDKLIEGNNVSWAPDGKHLASDEPYDELPPVIWDTQTGEVLGSLDFVGVGELHPFINAPMEWSPGGKWVAGGGSLMNMNSGFDDGFVAIWDAQTGQQTALLLAGMKSERIQSLAWSPDQRWLAAGAVGGKIFLWDVQTQTLAAVLSGHVGYVLDLHWSPDGKLLASSGDGTVLVWKVP